MIARLGFCLLTFVLIASAFAKEPVVPAGGPAPVGPYSPGILAGGYVYVAGQGARAGNGEMPSDGDTPPARTTVQQTTSAPGAREPDEDGRIGTLEQISIVAVRSSTP